MEINVDNLVNKDIFQTKKFDNITNNLEALKEDKALRQVSNDFESFFLNQILDVSLRNTAVAGEGTGSDIIKGMYLQSMADNATGTFGISDMLYDFLSKNNRK
jgi:Rod binding domain-containing protein